MTTTQTLERPAETIVTSNRPHAIDRVAMKIAIALLEWTNARIARADRARRENTQRLHDQKSQWLREADALRLSLRIGL